MALGDVSLFCLLASAARRAVVLRRGPARQVLALGWDLSTDELLAGDWLFGRIYEWRCDLSADAMRLLYFAQQQRPARGFFTALSVPPSLVPLRSWPSPNAASGGGLLEPELWLCPPPARDIPLLHRRLTRDGWRHLWPAGLCLRREGDRRRVTFAPPLAYARASSVPGVELRLEVRSLRQKVGQNLDVGYVLGAGGKELRLDAQWADFDRQGDLLFSSGARLFRLSANRVVEGAAAATLVADLAELRLAQLPPLEPDVSADT